MQLSLPVLPQWLGSASEKTNVGDISSGEQEGILLSSLLALPLCAAK